MLLWICLQCIMGWEIRILWRKSSSTPRGILIVSDRSIYCGIVGGTDLSVVACLSAEPGDISLLMPSVFGEVLLRVYTRDSR